MTNQAFDLRIALDPSRSVVVEACAGSGKTWLLVSRILRALLAGADPAEILAITFTRKAALEMQARLSLWLEMLATADEAKVREALFLRGIAEDEMPALLPLARGLYEKSLMARPGITLTTFHGWFLEVLRRAPIDAGIAHFELTDQVGMLEKEAWLRLKDRLRKDPTSRVAKAFDTLVSEVGLYNTRVLLRDFLAHRADWLALAQGEHDPIAAAQQRLSESAGVTPDIDVVDECLSSACLEELGDYANLLERFASGPNSDHAAHAAELHNALALGSPQAIFESACNALLTRRNEARRLRQAKESAKRLGEDASRFFALHERLAAKLISAKERLASQHWLILHEAGLICGTALLEAYQALKEARQLFDFADIEWLTARLLADSDVAEYLQYKLDARYRHILLDEFQDTNPLQWKILRTWLEASQEAGRAPVVFVVGDPKQSIYHFRGADARLFDEAAAFLIERQGAIKLMHNTTRRLAPPVLDIVNRSFAALKEVYPRYQEHTAHKNDLAGYVEVIPLFPTPAQPPVPDRLRDPLTTPLADSDGSPHKAEAQYFAEKLKEIKARFWVQEEDIARPLRWSDILVLVRTRKHLATYEQALKAAGIPALSSRQGGLLDTLEARDLIALLTFLVTPSANLELAHTLRSPLFACSDEDLLSLAGNKSWWHAIKDSDRPKLSRAAGLLGRWRSLAGRLPVHDLLDRIFHEGDLMSHYLAAAPPAMRAGIAANLNSLMELALNLSGGRYLSLPRFVFELKRLRGARAEEAPDEADATHSEDAICLMTVHSAKGLERPVVWLLDAGPAKMPTDSYRVLSDWPPGEDRPQHFSLFFKQAISCPQQRELLQNEAKLIEVEDYNLLYVAMTRAKQALFVSGNDSRNTRTERNWHACIRAAFGEHAADVPLTYGKPLVKPVGLAEPTSDLVSFPSNRAHQLPVVPTGTRKASADRKEIRLGIQVHRILEQLTSATPVSKEALRRQQPEDFDRAWQIAQTIVQADGLKRFFDPGQFLRAHNELTYVDNSGKLQRIDRLVEFENEFWVLDYKTGEADASLNPTELVSRYRHQLDEYARAVKSLWPGKPVRVGLVLNNGMLIPVPS